MAFSRKPPPKPRDARAPNAAAARVPDEQDLVGNHGALERMRKAPEADAAFPDLLATQVESLPESSVPEPVPAAPSSGPAAPEKRGSAVPGPPTPETVWDDLKATQERERHLTGTDIDTGNPYIDAAVPNVVKVSSAAGDVPTPVPDLEAIERAGHANQDAWDGTREEREDAATDTEAAAEEARRRAEEAARAAAEEARRRAEEERLRAEEAAAQAASEGQGVVSGAVDTVKGWF